MDPKKIRSSRTSRPRLTTHLGQPPGENSHIENSSVVSNPGKRPKEISSIRVTRHNLILREEGYPDTCYTRTKKTYVPIMPLECPLSWPPSHDQLSRMSEQVRRLTWFVDYSYPCLPPIIHSLLINNRIRFNEAIKLYFFKSFLTT